MKWISKIGKALFKTSEKITENIKTVITKKKLDEHTLIELEEILISSDLGIETSQKLVKELSEEKYKKDIKLKEIKAALAKIIKETLTLVDGKLNFLRAKPHIVLVCGVNGNGKTTTIGKIARRYTKQKKKVVMAACDTFRSAAKEQLGILAKLTKSEFIHGEDGSDPASVAYKAVDYAQKNKTDIVLIDTAGRLSNKKPLMDELGKIDKVIKKLIPDAPHDTILIIDATVGQNAIHQVESFKEIVNLTGLIVTKLDSSAKAGIVVSLASYFKVPVIAVGTGESMDDLDDFDAKEFSENILG